MKLQNSLIGSAILASLGAGFAVCRAQDEESIPQVLNDQSFERWRDFIHPQRSESDWERVDWQTTLWAGLRLAQEKKKPFLVWTMTGHPCGMT